MHLETFFKSNIVIAVTVPFYWTVFLLGEGDTSNPFTEALKGKEIKHTLTDTAQTRSDMGETSSLLMTERGKAS